MKAFLETNPSQTIREISEGLGVSETAVADGLKRLGKAKSSKMGAHDLSDRQGLSRFEISSLLLRHQNDPFLDQAVACDEKWVLYNNRRRSGQWVDVPHVLPKAEISSEKDDGKKCGGRRLA